MWNDTEVAPNKTSCFNNPEYEINPGDTGQSWLIKNPFHFGLVRLGLGLYVWAFLAYGLFVQHTYDVPTGIDRSPWWTWWIYNTNWGWNMLAIYFICAAIQSFRENSRTKRGSVQTPTHGTSWFEMYVWISFQLTFTAAIFVAINFWVFIMGVACNAEPETCPPMSPYSWNAHLINIFLILIELFLNRLPFKPIHVLFSIGYSILWLFFSVIWWVGTNFWIYPVQNPNQPNSWLAYAFYPGFILMYFGFFFLGFGIERLLCRLISSRKSRNSTFGEYEHL